MGRKIDGRVSANEGFQRSKREMPRTFWTLSIVGVALMGYGVIGLFIASDDTNPTQWVRWFFGGALVHDFLIAPIVIAVGAFIVRFLPHNLRAVAQGALLSSAIVAATAWPFVAGFGRRPDNKSVLPNNYALGLLGVIGVIWLAAAAIFVLQHLRGKRAMPPD